MSELLWGRDEIIYFKHLVQFMKHVDTIIIIIVKKILPLLTGC